MLGILFIYFIGKAFYDLAGLYTKTQWGFAILGVLSYYAGTVIGGLLIGAVVLLAEIDIEGTSDFVFGLLTTPFGVLACWGFYKLLAYQWSKQPDLFGTDDVLDANIMNDSPDKF